jgi:hypothetical protein
MNDLANMLSKRLPGGQPPSGKSMEEILLAVRLEAHTLNEDESAKKSEAKGGYTRHVFLETWYPAEWEVFVVYGAASPNPEEAFDCKYVYTPISRNRSQSCPCETIGSQLGTSPIVCAHSQYYQCILVDRA